MIATLEREAIAELWADRAGSPRVTILMPLAEPGPQRRQDPIRLQNLISQCQSRLDESQQHLLEPLKKMVSEKPFWENHFAGLAILSGNQTFHCIGLDFKPEPTAAVADRFELLPLLARPTEHLDTVVLSIHRGEARLYRGARPGALEPLELDIPRSIEEVSRWERRVGLATTRYTSSRPTADQMLQGGDQMERLEPEWDQRFVGAIFRKLKQEIASDTLLMLDCSSELESLCQESLAQLSNPWVKLDARLDSSSLDEVRGAADDAALLWNQRRLIGELDEVRELSPELRSSDLGDLLRAAPQGRIKKLYLSPGLTGSDDRVEKLVLDVLSHSGRLIGTGDDQLPEGILGVFRWCH